MPQIPSPLVLPAAADFHVHLRDGLLSAAVIPTLRPGGVNTAYVMPNLVPPVTTVSSALAYHARLLALGNGPVEYLMTLYLTPGATTPALVREAAASGVVRGIKSYPQGVTTNSASGVSRYDEFFEVFAEMERVGLVLNLHGEVPPEKGGDTTVLNAESRFLPTLRMLHEKFPQLRIVLEHCTTRDAVEAVRACGDTVVGTITAHHLFLTIDDWAADVHCYCKPVAKTPDDRLALLQAVVSSSGKFFLGTDSAPHPVQAKKGPGKTAAGVFTQPHAVGLVLTALDEAMARGDVAADDVSQEVLEGFLGGYGRRFYGVEDSTGERIRCVRDGVTIGERVVAERAGETVEVVPFRAGLKTWSVEWLEGGDEGGRG